MPGNPSFDKIYTKPQWTAARNSTGLLIAMTEKVSLGNEFAHFQHDKANPERALPAAERLLEKIKQYQVILNEKHKKALYFKKLSKVIAQQRAFLETGIKFADTSEELAEKALQRVAATLTAANELDTRLKNPRTFLFANHRIELETELDLIQSLANNVREKLQHGAPGQGTPEKVVALEKDVEKLRGDLEAKVQENLEVRRTLERLGDRIAQVYGDRTLKASKDHAVQELLERLQELHESEKRAVELIKTQPDVPSKAQNSITRIEGLFKDLKADLVVAAKPDYKKPEKHWKSLEPAFVGEMNGVLSQYHNVELVVTPQQMIEALLGPVKDYHTREFDPLALTKIENQCKKKATEAIAKVVKKVAVSGENSPIFRLIPEGRVEPRPQKLNRRSPGQQTDGPKKVGMNVDRSKSEDLTKPFESLAKRLTKASNPEAAIAILNHGKLVDGVLAGSRVAVPAVLTVGKKLKEDIGPIRNMLGGDAPDLPGAREKLRELIGDTRPVIDRLANAGSLWTAIERTIFVPLERAIEKQ